MAGSDNIDKELDSLMGELENNSRLRVDCVLKESPFEVTQRVYELREDGSKLGPYIRKIFPGNTDTRELGSAYKTLLDAQNAGARFAHLPRILQVTDTVDSLIVIMEYVKGATLRELIEARADKRAEITRAVFPLLCDAASELHEGLDHTIIHRDITPSNIICTGDGIIPVSVVLVDLGIARTHKPESTGDTTRFGTAAYAAPEQYGYGQTDVRTDIYAMGAALAFCLTGVDPNPGNTPALQNANGISPSMRAIIEKAMAFDPGTRFASAREMREAFLAATKEEDGDTASSPAPSASTDTENSAAPQSKPRMNAKRNIILVSAALVLLVALAIVLWNAASGPTAPSTSASSSPTSAVSSSSAKQASRHEEPVISEYGYSQDEYGMIWYGAAITNPSANETVGLPTLHVTATDDAGNVVASKDQVFGFIQPGQTVYFGEPLSSSQAPAHMSFELDTKSATYQPAGETISFSCTKLSDSSDGFTNHFRGEVNLEGTLPEQSGIQVVIILRDEAGKIVAGRSAYPSVPDKAQSTSFDVSWPSPPAYASWEAHATQWL